MKNYPYIFTVFFASSRFLGKREIISVPKPFKRKENVWKINLTKEEGCYSLIKISIKLILRDIDSEWSNIYES